MNNFTLIHLNLFLILQQYFKELKLAWLVSLLLTLN